MTDEIPFGFMENGRVRLHEFYADPDGYGLHWYRPLDAVVDLAGREETGISIETYSGRCNDTAEYTSRLGEMGVHLLRNARKGTTLVVFDIPLSDSGTRTFRETLRATYYR